MKRKIIIGSGLAVCLLIIVPVLMDQLKTNDVDYNLTAQSLAQEFISDEGLAMKKYAGKQITIKGNLADTDKRGFLIIETGKKVRISCLMADDYNWETVKEPGMPVIISGECTGLLMDIQLVNCTVK